MKKYLKLGILIGSILSLSACGSSGGSSSGGDVKEKPVNITKQVEALEKVESGSSIQGTSSTQEVNNTQEIQKAKNDLNEKIRNNMEIDTTDEKSMKSEEVGKTVENKGIIEMKSTGKKDVGIFTARGGEGTNSGEVNVNGTLSDGMGAYNNAKITNAENAKIIISKGSANSIGMYVSGEDPVNTDVSANGSTGINLGTIDVNGPNSIGIYGTQNAKVINSGTINLNAAYSGELYPNAKTDFQREMNDIQPTGIFVAGNNTTVENSGTINVNMTNGIGINAEDGATVTNTNSGIINVNANFAVGISADGKETTVINEGTINLNGNNGIGIELSNGATLKNTRKGTIHIKKGTINNTGVMENGSEVKNKGNVIID